MVWGVASVFIGRVRVERFNGFAPRCASPLGGYGWVSGNGLLVFRVADNFGENEDYGSVQKPVLIHLSDFFNFLSLCGSNLDRIMPSQVKIKPRTRPHVEMKSESKSLGTKFKP